MILQSHHFYYYFDVISHDHHHHHNTQTTADIIMTQIQFIYIFYGNETNTKIVYYMEVYIHAVGMQSNGTRKNRETEGTQSKNIFRKLDK